MMTLNFFKFVFLNYLLCFSASYDPSLGKAYNNSGAAIRGMANSLIRKRHEWQLTKAIIGRYLADITKYQFHAVLVANIGTTKESYCDAMFISDKKCITAAVCVFDLNQPRYKYYEPSNLKVLAGATDSRDITSGLSEISVEHVAAPDDFQQNPQRTIFEGGSNTITLKQDVGLVIIQGTFSNTGNTVLLPTESNFRQIFMKSGDTHCTAFGSTSLASTSDSVLIKEVPLQLHEADVILVDFDKCNYRWKNYGIQLNRNIHICAVGMSYGVCMGENGGGLICRTTWDRYIVGVSSMQMGCGSHSAPIIFNRVDAAVDFFNQASTPPSEKSAQSSGDCIHNQHVPHYYGASLTRVLLVTLFIKSGF